MVSEQCLFYEGLELNNDKSLLDYKIKPGDTLTLKVSIKFKQKNRSQLDSNKLIKLLFLQIDKVTVLDEDTDEHVYSSNHLPEIGFKGKKLEKNQTKYIMMKIIYFIFLKGTNLLR